MSITNFIKSCTKNIAGNDHQLFFAPARMVTGITVTTGEVSAVTMSDAVTGPPAIPAGLFSVVEADLDSVQFTSDGTAAKGYYSQQNLIAKFSKKSVALEKLVAELVDAATCGIVAIRVDGNGKAWISGVAQATDGGNRPYMSVQEQFDSGESIEDSEDGNRYTITLSRMSAVREYPLDDTLTASVIGGTAAFIDWP